MNTNEEAIKTTAILQDAVNDVHDSMPGGTSMWARTGDEIWTASIAPTSGYDPSGLAYEAGDLVVRRNTVDGDRTRITGGFLALPEPNKNPMSALVEGISQWSNGANPDEIGTVTNHGQARLTVPQTGQPLATGWSEALAQAESVAANNITDIALLRASLLQAALDQADKPTVWFLDENQYDLVTLSWQVDSNGMYDSFTFTHWQVDEFDNTVKIIAHSEATAQTPRTMSDEQLLEDSRNIADSYQSMRFHDGGDVSRGMSWTVAQNGIVRDNEKPLLQLADGRLAPEWNQLVDETALDIASGKTSLEPSVRQEADTPNADEQPRATRSAEFADRPNVWVANPLAHPYTRLGRDGRTWQKMIVTMPAGTLIDGQDLGGWALDRFMSPANMQRKQAGRGINVWFTPNQPVELFHGRGEQRRSITIDDPKRLVSAIIQAEKHVKTQDAQTKQDKPLYTVGDGSAAAKPPEWSSLEALGRVAVKRFENRGFRCALMNVDESTQSVDIQFKELLDPSGKPETLTLYKTRLFEGDQGGTVVIKNGAETMSRRLDQIEQLLEQWLVDTKGLDPHSIHPRVKIYTREMNDATRATLDAFEKEGVRVALREIPEREAWPSPTVSVDNNREWHGFQPELITKAAKDINQIGRNQETTREIPKDDKPTPQHRRKRAR